MNLIALVRRTTLRLGGLERIARPGLPALLSTGLALLLAAQAVNFVLPLRPRPPGGADPVTAPGTADVPAPLSVRQIVDANLFGVSEAAELAMADAEASLALQGTLASNDPSAGSALLSADGGNARLVSVGTALPGIGRLKEVYAHRVVIDRGGRLEVLSLVRGDRSPRAAAPDGAGPAAEVAASAGPAAGEFRQLMSMRHSGQGVEVLPLDDLVTFEELGLRGGDIITQINGESMADGQAARNALNGLSNVPEAFVTVRRGGREIDLVLRLAQAEETSRQRAEEVLAAQIPAREPEQR